MQLSIKKKKEHFGHGVSGPAECNDLHVTCVQLHCVSLSVRVSAAGLPKQVLFHFCSSLIRGSSQVTQSFISLFWPLAYTMAT